MEALAWLDKDGKYWAFTYDPRYQLRSETKCPECCQRYGCRCPNEHRSGEV